jgi:hypothetical protein
VAELHYDGSTAALGRRRVFLEARQLREKKERKDIPSKNVSVSKDRPVQNIQPARKDIPSKNISVSKDRPVQNIQSARKDIPARMFQSARIGQ